MSQTLSAAETKLFILNKANSDKLLPICSALKLSGYDTALIAEIMQYIQSKETLPERFSIINNRYLACDDGLVYDLTLCQAMTATPTEPKKMALTFWI